MSTNPTAASQAESIHCNETVSQHLYYSTPYGRLPPHGSVVTLVKSDQRVAGLYPNGPGYGIALEQPPLPLDHGRYLCSGSQSPGICHALF